MKNFLKRLRYFIYLRSRNILEIIPWKTLDLNLTTPTGIHLFIKDRSDWHVYNEIFARGDYDFAIDTALSGKANRSSFHFIDLGANTGFFSFRVLDKLLSNSTTPDVHGIAVEASLKVYRDMQERVLKNNSIKQSVQLVQGLAGKKEGFAKIYESGSSLTNSVVATSGIRKNLSGTKVSFVDVSKFFGSDIRIDLLKCDIEGSEQDFITNYPDILQKTQVLVIELHHKKCNTLLCMQKIEENGLLNSKTIFDYGNDVSLKVYWRN